ncbi:uncharacterized protein LOC144031145 [Festucalex cinctus]
MNSHKNVAYSNTSRSARTATRGQNGRVNEQSKRVPEEFKERTTHTPMRPTTVPKSRSTSAMVTGARAAQTQPQPLPVQPPPGKWKSSFKPIENEDPEDESQEQSNEEGTELYAPFDPPMQGLPAVNLWEINSNSPPEQNDNLEWQCSPPKQDDNLDWQHSPPEQGGNLERQCMPEDRSIHVIPPWILGRALDIHDLSPERRLSESHIVSPFRQQLAEQRPYSPDMKSKEPQGYRFSGRSFSPDRHTSTPQYLASYGRERTNGEEMTRPEYRNPIIPRVRLSSPTLQRDYEINEDPIEAELEHDEQMPRVKRRGKNFVQMEQIAINCDLCEVEVSNGQELEKHLQSKIHWDTMEHIQQQNNYDDMTIAFLQDVMLYKRLQCSRPIHFSHLQALEENEHMTKMSLFHCAACHVLVSTAEAAVHKHIDSSEHLFNTKEFEAQRRRTSLDKAETITRKLQPQFENFIKGCSQF